MDLVRELGADGSEITLFSKLESVPTEPEDGEWGEYKEGKNPRFIVYSPPAHMHNVDLSAEDGLEFAKLPLKRYNIKNGVNFHMPIKLHAFVPQGINNRTEGIGEDAQWVGCIIQQGMTIVSGAGEGLCTTTTACSMDAECSTICFGPSSNALKYFSITIRWLMRHVCPQPDICIILDRGTGILFAIERQGSLWDYTHHWYCLRHVAFNYYKIYPSNAERAQVTNIDVDQNLCHIGVVDGYVLDSFLVQPLGWVVVVRVMVSVAHLLHLWSITILVFSFAIMHPSI
ncbi:hypothetical protein J1N35_000002 [Gossypium stocksii]|uniref:MULE transposase domain-containing protein n=1 Tax=Gossypium stocksii TaxID=47602 RepID=A0A9D3WH85_9ROSI|nr:hypothetical protein J1N35_000002 [Gossypium stocksii]